jgi:putative ABC transport system permease protein
VYLIMFFVFSLVTGIIAGIYPSINISTISAIKGLKGSFSTGIKGNFLRSSLTVVQFTVSVCLIISTLIVLSQLNFMQKKNIGFNKENVVVITHTSSIGAQREAFRTELERLPFVASTSWTRKMPGDENISLQTFKTAEMKESISITSFFTDDNFFETLKIPVISGRGFIKDNKADSASVILNQSAVNALKLKEPVGTKLNDNLTVVGVVPDFHIKSVREKIEPLAFTYTTRKGFLALRLTPGSEKESVKAIQDVWGKFNKAEPMKFYFLDENIGKLLRKEEVLAKSIGAFSLIAIIISSLGLFALATHVAQYKRKEIGIRKVLGADISQVLIWIISHFLKPIFISLLIAGPLTWYIMKNWLDNFAYRVNIEPVLFVYGFLIILGVALATIIYQSMKAAGTDPVKVLKSE